MIRLVVAAGYEDYLQNKFPNYYTRLEDLEQVAGFADQYETPEEFLSELALLSNLDTESKRDTQPDPEQIRLSTIHQAKGLEFEVVFVMMLCDGLFPQAARSRAPTARRRSGGYLRRRHPGQVGVVPELSADALHAWLRRRDAPAAVALPQRDRRRPRRGVESAKLRPLRLIRVNSQSRLAKRSF